MLFPLMTRRRPKTRTRRLGSGLEDSSGGVSISLGRDTIEVLKVEQFDPTEKTKQVGTPLRGVRL
jgi:hypothetical protein